MLSHRLWRRPDINTTLGQRLGFARQATDSAVLEQEPSVSGEVKG